MVPNRYPALRIEGMYLALATLALALAMPQFLKYDLFEEWTGGVQGIVIDKPEAPFGLPLNPDQWLYFFTLAILLLAFVLGWNLVSGRTGRALVAIRDHRIAAQSMGINTALYKSVIFGVSAMYTGVAGVLSAIVIQFVAPDSFTLFLSIFFVVGIVVGGLGSITGAIYGGFFIQFVPHIADAFSQGTVGSYIDAHSSSAVIANPQKSKVLGKIGFARWPKGPSGRRVTSIWNWSFPINAALSKKAKTATWLYIQWAACTETQARTSYKFTGPTKRSGVNRDSIWGLSAYTSILKDVGHNFIEATVQSMQMDTDVDWRPRVPQWPAVGNTMAIAIQAALVGQDKPKPALDKAQARIDKIMRT